MVASDVTASEGRIRGPWIINMTGTEKQKTEASINLVMLSCAGIRTTANKHIHSRQAREALESFKRFVGAQSQASKMRA